MTEGDFDPSFFADTVLVIPKVKSKGERGGYVQADGTGVAYTVAVQRVVSSGGLETRGINPYEQPLGQAQWNVLFQTNPGELEPNTLIHWTANSRGAFASPRILATFGKVELYGGIGCLYRASCNEIE